MAVVAPNGRPRILSNAPRAPINPAPGPRDSPSLAAYFSGGTAFPPPLCLSGVSGTLEVPPALGGGCYSRGSSELDDNVLWNLF